MTIRLIAAVSANGVIGVNGELPWSIKDDLKLFKELTMNRAVLMGGETYRSLPGKLKGRTLIVLSRSLPPSPDYILARDFGEVRQRMGSEVDIVGGESVYRWAIESGLVDELILTHVQCWVASFRGDKVTRLDFSKLDSFVPTKLITEGFKSPENEFPFKAVRYTRNPQCNKKQTSKK